MVSAPRRRRRPPKSTQAGQGLVEYALILVLIVIVAIASVTYIGTGLSGYLSMIGTSV